MASEIHYGNNSRMVHTPKSYKIADGASEGLLFMALIFAPWAFGTTEPWSIRVLDYAGYGMGLLLLLKRLICWKTGYTPLRWSGIKDEKHASDPAHQVQRFARLSIGITPLILLTYCLIAAINSRATYHHDILGFTYHENYISWLPHSYDSHGTWTKFQSYLALFCFFWATRDWVQGTTRKERHPSREAGQSHSPDRLTLHVHPPSPMPARFRRVLWILCLNGAILGLVSILHKLDGTNKLLWIKTSLSGYTASNFGPYSYRSNAAQYFNLLWPICIGFWWSLHFWHQRRLRLNRRLGSGSQLLLLPVSIIIAISPVISNSRGGALLCFVGIPLVMLAIYFTSPRGRHWISILVIFTCLLCAGLYLGWASLQQRLIQLQDITQDMSSRERLDQYARTWQMIRDFPLFGIGPNAYEATYPLYRFPGQQWYPYAHSDWLQFLAEWGIAGFSLILFGLFTCLIFPWIGPPPSMPLAGTFLISFLLVLTHATFDFPMQVYSLLFTFIILLALYVSLPKASFA